MKQLVTIIENLLTQSAAEILAEQEGENPIPIQVTPATQEIFGHYQCNTPMKLAKSMKKNPREIAESIRKTMAPSIFRSVEIAGPGFINLTLDSAFLSQYVDQMVKDPRLGIPLPEVAQRIIVEFSSPNIAKEMHVGHLRSTIIGEAFARLFTYLGHQVIRLNHVGDWGTAFGMLIVYMKEHVPDVVSGKEKTDLPHLMSWYREAKKQFDTDEAFKTRARLAVVALQSGDPEARRIWEVICEISRHAFQEVYDILDVELEERGESYYNFMLPEIVEELEGKGLITLSEGAKCVFHEGISIPLMVQKSDGGFNYDTTDMAAMRHRVEVEKADRIIIVTDAGQSVHFTLIRKTAEQAGYLDPKRVSFDHVPFGLVLGSDGKKFRTRSGEVERLIDLLHTAIESAEKILRERGDADLNEAEISHLGRVLGINAVKYADLSCHRMSDYVFSYEKMLRFEGNTAAFILYSYVRVRGIKRKVGDVDIQALMAHTSIALSHSSELSLGLHLARFAEALQQMEKELLPNVLTDYLYLLAQKFNAFFRDCRVEGTPEQNSRLLLCELVSRVMAQGLFILGIQTVDKM